MKNFKQFLKEKFNTAYFTFLKMNPPTVHHGLMLDALCEQSGKYPYFVYLSQVHEESNNPLNYSEKVKYSRKSFPKHGRSILINKDVNSTLEAATDLYAKGYNNIVVMVSEGDVKQTQIVLEKYNNVKGNHGYFLFEKIEVEGFDGDPDGLLTEQNDFVRENNFGQFCRNLSEDLSNKDARRLFNDLRKGMHLEEINEFKNHIELEPVSDTREQYVKGNLFEIGDMVFVDEGKDFGEITWLGSNYVVVQLDENTKIRKWIDDVELVEEGRVRFDRMGLDHVDPTLTRFLDRVVNSPIYKKVVAFYMDELKKHPEKSKTQVIKMVSKVADVDYRNLLRIVTKMERQGLLPEGVEIKEENAVDQAKERIDRQKERNKQKYDRILDRARIRAARQKNNETDPDK